MNTGNDKALFNSARRLALGTAAVSALVAGCVTAADGSGVAPAVDDSALAPASVVTVAASGVDDTTAIQDQLTAGNIVGLNSGSTYRITRVLNVTKSNSGIVTVNGSTPAVLVIKDALNNVEPLQMFDPTRNDSIGIRADSNGGTPLSGIRLENFTIQKEYHDGTYVGAIWFRGVNDSNISGIDMSGFALGAIVALDTVNRVSVRGCNIHDSYANSVSSYANFPQLSGVVVDDNKLSGVGSTGVTIADNSFVRLRFGSALYNKPRNLFPGMSGSNDIVGIQTDGVTVVHGGSGTTVVGNVFDTVAEGVDCMADSAVIRNNVLRNIFDWGIKFVHGATSSLIEDNDVGASGSGPLTVAGTSSNLGTSFGQLFRNNRITQVGVRSAYCGSSVSAPFQLWATCPTDQSARAYAMLTNGATSSASAPNWNMFFGNTVTAVSTDVRMQYLVYVEPYVQNSLFYGNTFSDGTGRGIGDSISGSSGGTVRDTTATGFARGDFNGDGRQDWFVHWNASGNSKLYLQGANGTYTVVTNPIPATAINGSPDNLVSGDFDGDGKADLLFHWKSAGTNKLFQSWNGSSFAEVDNRMNTAKVGADAVAGTPDLVLTGDYDHDGRTDVAFIWKHDGLNHFYYGGPSGAFTQYYENPIAPSSVNSTPDRVLVGDYDGDHKADLLFYWTADGTNRFFYGTGTGTFAYVSSPIPPGAINGSQNMIVVDANGDGRQDLLSWQPNDRRRLYLGQGSRSFVRDGL